MRQKNSNTANGPGSSRESSGHVPMMSRLVPETDTNQIDRLLISCRRLCVDNHLNQTLHTSILETAATAAATAAAANGNAEALASAASQRGSGSRLLSAAQPSAQLGSTSTTTIANSSSKLGGLDVKIKNFYGTIPVLVHDSLSNPRTMRRFMSSVCGKNVKICQPDCLIAYRESSIVQLKER